MPDDEKLTPADPSDLAQSISFALRFHGRMRFHRGDEFMANLTADHIVRYLERCRFDHEASSHRRIVATKPARELPANDARRLEMNETAALSVVGVMNDRLVELESALRAQTGLISEAQELLTRYLSKEIEAPALATTKLDWKGCGRRHQFPGRQMEQVAPISSSRLC